MQLASEVQPPGLVHPLAQAVGPQMFGAQARITSTEQVPLPLQVRASDSTPLLQLAAPQLVPAATELQLPALPGSAQDSHGPAQPLSQHT
jgi:hypothetical protein